MQFGLFMMPLHPSYRAIAAVDVAYLMEHLWIVGDPPTCADKSRKLYEAAGGFGTLLAITQDSDDSTWDHCSLQLLMEEVGPRLADLP